MNINTKNIIEDKALFVSNRALDEIEDFLENGLKPCYKDIEDFFIDISANICAHWTEEQYQKNIEYFKNDERYEILKARIFDKYGENYLKWI